MNNGPVPLARFRYLHRIAATVPALQPLGVKVSEALSALELPLRGRRVAVAVGSRGVASLAEIVSAACAWLRTQGAVPFIFPAMGSHGGGTAEGQRNVLEQLGVTPESVGAEISSSMQTVALGLTAEGFQAFMDQQAWQSDGVLVINRVKPHTDFTGRIESGLSKMIAVGMGKLEGAQECHRWARKHGHERVVRSISTRVLEQGKILAGLAVIENELHEVCALRAARPENLVAVEEAALEMARPLVPRLPFSRLHLLAVDELGKNISGAGMDTKVIGRGVRLQPGDATEIKLVYVRDMTAESGGNAIGIGMADLTHARLHAKIDFQKTYLNVLTSLNLPMGRFPIHLPSDREALDFALKSLGSPDPAEQRIAWIRNTLDLERIAVSESLAPEVSRLRGWRLSEDTFIPQFDAQGDIVPR